MNRPKHPSKLVFNCGEPMFTPNLRNAPSVTLTESDRLTIMAEMNLISTAGQWHEKTGTQEMYAELAMIYSTAYAQRIEASSLLLTFQTAITELEVQRKVHTAKHGETEKSEQAYRRNQMFMHVHQFASAMVEKNNQALLIAKNATEKLVQYATENRDLKKRLEAVKNAEEWAQK